MKQWHYNKIKKDKKHKRPRAFVLALHKTGVPISKIDTNSWEHSNPSVYIWQKGRYPQSKIYKRFSSLDLKNALKYYRNSK